MKTFRFRFYLYQLNKYRITLNIYIQTRKDNPIEILAAQGQKRESKE